MIFELGTHLNVKVLVSPSNQAGESPSRGPFREIETSLQRLVSISTPDTAQDNYFNITPYYTVEKISTLHGKRHCGENSIILCCAARRGKYYKSHFP